MSFRIEQFQLDPEYQTDTNYVLISVAVRRMPPGYVTKHLTKFKENSSICNLLRELKIPFDISPVHIDHFENGLAEQETSTINVMDEKKKEGGCLPGPTVSKIDRIKLVKELAEQPVSFGLTSHPIEKTTKKENPLKEKPFDLIPIKFTLDDLDDIDISNHNESDLLKSITEAIELSEKLK